MQKSSTAKGHSPLLLCLFIVGLMAALFILPFQFPSKAGGAQKGLFQRTESHQPGLENYDIRTVKDDEVAEALFKYRRDSGKDAAMIADIKDGFVRGEENLRTRVKTVKTEYSPDLGQPEVITPDMWKSQIERLSAPSATKRSEILRNFVKDNNQLVGIEDAQADQLVATADYTNPNGYMSFAHLEQRINSVPVFRGEIKAGFTKSGEIIRIINNLAPGVDYESVSTDFRNPVDAVRAAFRNINAEPTKLDVEINTAVSTDLKAVFGNGDNATTAERMYFPTEPGVVVPSWRVLIWQPVNAFYVIVDAESGRMLWRKNITEDQTQSATYQIYDNVNGFINAADSPAPLSPGPIDPTTGTQGALLTRTNRTLIGNEGAYSFVNNGWITDNANSTDGNFVEAGTDRIAPDGVDAPQPGDGACPGAGCRVFSSTWNPAPGNPAPGDDPLTAQATRGAVIQMFYVMNRYQAEMYRLGFTEQSFNFQNDNFGRGGAGADRVRAEGQDSSGTNNANMSTPADGGRGRMQMFVWTGPTPDYDGTADAEVIIHEVTHGLSNRLHGNAAGLSTNMARGMGEGWSDFYSYTMLSEPTDPINGIYTTGGYATFLIAAGFTGNYYYGIRRFPRAPITFLGPNGKPHNPYTFQYVNANCNTLIGTTTSNPPPNSAFPRGPVGSATCDQVHNIGEIWSSMLWEVRNRFVTRLGHSVGTRRVLQVVTDGMKLAPTGPTILQERDAIIAAASALPVAPEASADVLDVRDGFRVRGAGFSAVVNNAGTGANNTVVTEAFDVPNAIIQPGITVSDSTGDNDGFPEPGETLSISVPILNSSGAAITNVNGSITGGGTSSYGTIADGATVVRNISYTVPGDAVCGSIHTVTVTGTSDLGALNPRQHSFQLGVPVGGAPVTFESNTLMNLPNGQPATTSGVAGPYSSDIAVSGLSGNKKIKVELTTNNHTWGADLDMLLEGPGGQKFIIMSDAFNVSNQTGTVTTTMTIRDDAAANMPAATVWPAVADFKPTNHTTGDPFAAPAPAGPYVDSAPAGAGTFASVFGTDSSAWNGTWKLWVVDDAGGDFGTMQEWKITFESNAFSCSVTPSSVESRADFDGDGKTDVSVFRPSEGNWYLNRSTAGLSVQNWGISTDVLTPGDYDGDNKADLAVFRATADSAQPDFYILNSATSTLRGASWGVAGDIPVVADYDGDDKEDVAVFRPSSNTWFILNSGGAPANTIAVFGQAGDVPVAGDFDGDGKGDQTVYRAGTWITQRSGGGSSNTALGAAGDILVPADYDGDNKDDVAVFRPSTGQWFVTQSSNSTTTINIWGTSGDVPVPGDYDGDGKDDRAIYRGGQWWLDRSTSGVLTQNFGVGTDRAIPRSYIP